MFGDARLCRASVMPSSADQRGRRAVAGPVAEPTAGSRRRRGGFMNPTMQIVLGWLLFGGTHTALSHPPLRSRLVARLGERGFLLCYSLVAFATFVPLVWLFFARRISAAVPLPVLATVPGIWWLTMGLMFVATNLIVIGFTRPNPVSALMAPDPSGGSSSPAAVGALRITRHPAFMGVALAGLAHLLVNPAPIDRAFFGGMAVYAVLGCAHQDWRRRKAEGPALERFFAETSFFPFVAIARGRNRLVLGELRPGILVVAAIGYGLLFFHHHRFFG
jgi:uncharacterized membrane protein